MKPHMREEFKRSFAEYLSKPEWQWNFVAHQTFDSDKYKLTAGLVEWSWGHFMRNVARDAMMNYGFCFAERGRMGRLHWHALVNINHNLYGYPSRVDLQDEQRNKFGFFSLIPHWRYPNPELMADKGVATGVSTYLSKYVAKEAFSDDATWDFTGFLGGSLVDSRRIARAIGVDRPRVD